MDTTTTGTAPAPAPELDLAHLIEEFPALAAAFQAVLNNHHDLQDVLRADPRGSEAVGYRDAVNGAVEAAAMVVCAVTGQRDDDVRAVMGQVKAHAWSLCGAPHQPKQPQNQRVTVWPPAH